MQQVVSPNCLEKYPCYYALKMQLLVFITLRINNDDKILQRNSSEQERIRFPWKSKTFSLDCPESGNGVKYVLCLNLNLYSRFFIQSNSIIQESLKSLFYLQF